MIVATAAVTFAFRSLEAELSHDPETDDAGEGDVSLRVYSAADSARPLLGRWKGRWHVSPGGDDEDGAYPSAFSFEDFERLSGCSALSPTGLNRLAWEFVRVGNGLLGDVAS